jgi:hypothetical protein
MENNNVMKKDLMNQFAVTGVLSLLMLSLISSNAYAERESTVIHMPGMKYEEKRGWFGTRKKVYRDVLGNTSSQSKNLFGQTTQDHNVFGFHAEKRPGKTQITTPSGKSIYQQKRGWFGKKETVIEGGAILDEVKQAIPANLPQTIQKNLNDLNSQLQHRLNP